MVDNKRKVQRQPMSYAAWIAQEGKPLRRCVVADISETGARLKVEELESIPEEFILVLSRRAGTRRRCRVAWRNEGHIGVEFPDSHVVKRNAMLKAREKSPVRTEAEPAAS
jgi:hypothetical protein